MRNAPETVPARTSCGPADPDTKSVKRTLTCGDNGLAIGKRKPAPSGPYPVEDRRNRSRRKPVGRQTADSVDAWFAPISATQPSAHEMQSGTSDRYCAAPQPVQHHGQPPVAQRGGELVSLGREVVGRELKYTWRRLADRSEAGKCEKDLPRVGQVLFRLLLVSVSD